MSNIIPLEDVFRGKLFTIPDYQRGYSWDQKNWDDLIEDIELIPEGRDHYTGTLVVLEAEKGALKLKDEQGASYLSYDLIDGQQRLTTLVLFLDAIHDELVRLGETGLAAGLEKNYLAVKDRNGQTRSKLTLNRDCHPYFYNDVLGFAPGIAGPQIRSHYLLKEAHEYFISYLAEQQTARKQGYKTWLQEHYFKIIQHITVLFYPVDNDIDAQVIFETMNDRGKPLTELEKVKNYLLYVATRLELPDYHDLSLQINQTWTEIFEELMSADLGDESNEDQLLRMHWLMAYDYNLKNWKSSRSIKDRFALRTYQGQHKKLLKDIKEYLHSLARTATAYCDIRNPRRAGAFNEISDPVINSQVVEASEMLARLGVRINFIPLLIAARLRADDCGRAYLEVVKLCEKADFRLYQWMGYRASAAQTALIRLGYDHYQKPDMKRLLDKLVRTVYSYCTNEQFSERFDRETENWYDWNGLKYFLYEYEKYLAGREHQKPHYLWEEIYGTDIKRDTIEHILPQARNVPYWKDHFSASQHKRWVHDIGNLTLTYDNSSLGTKSFPDKKGRTEQERCYASSKLFIEHELVRFRNWTESGIRKRRQALRLWAEERWHLDEPVGVLPEETKAKVDETGEQRLIRFSINNETHEEFQVLLAAIKKSPLYPRMQKNWRVVACTSPENRSQALLWFGPDLYVEFSLDNLQKIWHISTATVQAIMGDMGTKVKKLEPEDVDDFIVRLNELIEQRGN